MKKLLVFLMVLFLSLTFVSAQGQEEASTDGELNWPVKPINLIVPYSAGGNSDFNARAVAKYLPEILGKPVVVTNVPGSGGTIGAAQVKDAKADGYTILVHQLSLSIAEAAGMANYGIKDFTVGSVFSSGSSRRSETYCQHRCNNYVDRNRSAECRSEAQCCLFRWFR